MILQKKHMLEAIRLVNDRLPRHEATSDATIAAILFMAKAEVSYPSKERVEALRFMIGSQYFQGDHGAWSVHMDGVKRIVELRGGIGALPRLIQQKIYRRVILFTNFPAHDVCSLILKTVARAFQPAWPSTLSLNSPLSAFQRHYPHRTSAICNQPVVSRRDLHA